MSTLLDRLADGYDREQSLAMLRNEDLRNIVMQEQEAALQAVGMPDGMFDTHEGQSLFLAVLTLRLKFPLDEAHAKVERNIAMREGRN
jgi:hypothetical protein